MCLGLPCEVLAVLAEDAARVRTDSGAERTVSLAMLPNESLSQGDWVMVHLGFAMAKIDAAYAAETNAFLAELGLEA